MGASKCSLFLVFSYQTFSSPCAAMPQPQFLMELEIACISIYLLIAYHLSTPLFDWDLICAFALAISWSNTYNVNTVQKAASSYSKYLEPVLYG